MATAKSRLPRIVGVEHSVAGFASVPLDLLEKRLGVRAWHVLQVLWSCSDTKGLTHITRVGIALADGFVPMAVSSVKRGMERLVLAGLLENLGWTSKLVPVGTRYAYRKVYMRRVRGRFELATKSEERRCAVPEVTAEWLDGAAAWGGGRDRSGRKRTHMHSKDECINASIEPKHERIKEVDRAPDALFKCGQPLIKCGHSPPGLVFSSVATDTSKQLTRNDWENSFTKNFAPRMLGADSLRFGGEKLRTHTTQALRMHTTEALGTHIGDTLVGGARAPAPSPSLPIKNVPPYPGASLIPPATVPNPVKLDPSDTEEVHVTILGRAYRAAIEKQYGGTCHLLKKISPRAPSYPILARAASMLIDYDIPPVAWAVWITRRWYLIQTHRTGYKEGSRVRYPPVSFAFGAKQLEERCADPKRRYVVIESAVGGRVIFGKSHKALLREYEAMRRDINLGVPTREAVRRHFPGKRFDRLVETARTEAVDIRSRLEDDVKRGKVIW